jgi:hypothetical protein
MLIEHTLISATASSRRVQIKSSRFIRASLSWDMLTNHYCSSNSIHCFLLAKCVITFITENLTSSLCSTKSHCDWYAWLSLSLSMSSVLNHVVTDMQPLLYDHLTSPENRFQLLWTKQKITREETSIYKDKHMLTKNRSKDLSQRGKVGL